MCDVAYVMLLERLDRSLAFEESAIATALGMGAKGVQQPSLDDARRRFDEILEGPLEQADSKDAALRQALGVD